MMKKERIDVLLVERGHFNSRERAQAALMAGNVLVNEHKIEKAGAKVPIDAQIRIIGDDLPYVSRGGLKLAKAIDVFEINLFDKIVADIGASTGGFTDCALQNRARCVYAVDVGYGQLDWKLRNNPRVVNIERTNARYLTCNQLPVRLDFITIDVSFISLDKILPVVKDFLKEDGGVLALVKPQFEAGKEKIGKKGVVRDIDVHIEVLEKIVKMAKENAFIISGLDFSPIKGQEGNIEYLLYLTRTGEDNYNIEKTIHLAQLNMVRSNENYETRDIPEF